MDRGKSDDHIVKAALALAVRAPSVRNSQPWRWRIGDRCVHLYSDPTRATDSDQRDLVLSCGAALHHLRIALAARGWSAVVRRLPDPAQPDHLASIELVRHRPTPYDVALSDAITRRRTDRRHFSSCPVPPGYLGLVTERAAVLGAIVRHATDWPRDRLVQTMSAGAQRHAGNPDHRPEPTDETSEPDFAELLVLGTASDDRLARLCAGEALSAVLLTATNIGLATCLLTEPLELPALRHRGRVGVLDGGYPQAVIRIGWAPTGAEPLPATPRRAIEDVLDPFDATEATVY
ncbi:NAD(P)H nitroreductase [Nocardia sp. NBC_00565]|uniref:NAD(P)H nitroreductase n=1 Tax=Nocardia sp. NBC_00565 TaxID=2975993 RepID=UPI002E816D5B|nr:NAD(P)H nitroreductase [Nocardia sp. NBC_00565]WUC03297.1 NAD(P)H nitroreductase [Nocardia sp. NBC_00565]